MSAEISYSWRQSNEGVTMIVGIHHVAIGVSDLDAAVTFYTEAFGMQVVQRSEFDRRSNIDQAIGLKDAKAKMAMLDTSNAFIELWEYQNPEPRDLRSLPSDLGYPHFAWQVDDIQDEYDRLASLGMTFVGEVVHFGEATSAIYGRDPFGNVIELYEIKIDTMAQLKR